MPVGRRDAKIGGMNTSTSIPPAPGSFIECWDGKRERLFLLYVCFNPGGMILKSDIPLGARWVTVHPNGPDTKGTHLLIQETSPGSGVAHVIGGAGGKLNYLRLHTSTRSPAEAHQDAIERSKAKAEAKKAQRTKEVADGTRKQKQLARQEADSRLRLKEDQLIDYTAQAMGWKGYNFVPEDHPNLSDKALEAAERKHHREWFRKSVEAVNRYKKALLNDDEARAQALGHDPLVPGGARLDTSDIGLQPTRKALLGSSINYTKEAEKKGVTGADIKREAAEAAPEPTPGAGSRKVTAEAITKELEGFRTEADTASLEDPDAHPLDTNTIMNMALAEKAVKEARKAAVKEKEAIDSDDFKGAYHMKVSDVGMDEVRADLLNDLRTSSTHAFLSEIGERYGDKADATIGMSMVDGAYGALNALSLTVVGSGLMDKTVVDSLGISGAAQILVRKIRSQLSSEELDDLRGAMEDYHSNHYLAATEAAIKEVRDLDAAANAIDIDTAATTTDLETLKSLNNQRAAAVSKAQDILGRTLGEMEANAALIVALNADADAERLSLPMGNMTREEAITRARAIGLVPGDYQIHTVGRAEYLDVSGPGMDRMTKPIRREDIERYRESRAILTGERDEDGWMPEGVARRPDLAMDELQPGVAPQLAEPFAPGPGSDIPQAITDYIGGRAADGDAPTDIIADLNSQAMADKSGDPVAYWEALSAIVPSAGEDGKPLLADAHQERFESMADDFVKRRYGTSRAPFQQQKVNVNDPKTIDALHRTLAEVSEGTAAYKPIGDLTHAERRGLRQWFQANVGAKDDTGKALAEQLKAIEDREPPETAPSMFGDDEPNPEYAKWQQERNEKAAELSQSGLSWERYVEGMGSPEDALAAVQDLVRSEVSKRFAEQHNRLDPDHPIKVGRESIRGGLNHLDMIDPQAREERLQKQRDMIDDLRNRSSGRYAAGSVTDKLSAAAAAQSAQAQAQVDMFGFSDASEPGDAPLKGDQRYSLGHAAERQLAGIMQHVGQNFRPGDKLKIWAPSMSGKYILGQRAIKYIEANKRVALGLGTGTGKTIIGLGAYTDLLAKGKVKKGLFVVPSSVQGQFHGEALRYLEPGKFKWLAKPGATREERLAAMADPGTNFVVTTHQALRDDLLHLGAEAEGFTPSAMAERLDGMTPADRKAWAGKILEAHGIKPDFVMMDEAHGTLNRKGKENSALANVLDAVGNNAEYQILASADPVKNDASEIFSLLEKLDPARYNDRDEFLRKYGEDTPAKKAALRREMTPYLMTGRTDPGVEVNHSEQLVQMTPDQEAAISEIQKNVAAVRLGRITGKTDVAAMHALSPAAFDGVPEDQRAEVAKKLQGSIGVIQQSAMRSAIDDRGKSAKLDAASKIAAERKGVPGVIFAHSLEVARDLYSRLVKEGHRVGMLTGANSAEERTKIMAGFNPEGGDADATTDILIMSDAGAVGVNAQRGKWMIQYDTPVTAMAQPLDAKVLTQGGWVRMGDIEEGDEITTPNGGVARVVGVYPQGERPIVRITMADGASTLCTWDHLWFSASRDDRKFSRGYRARTTGHVASTLLHKEKTRERPNYVIPLIGRVNLGGGRLLVPPYMLGAILGDGCICESAIQFACGKGDEQIVERMQIDASVIGARVNHIKGITYTITGNGDHAGVYPRRALSPVLDGIRALGLSGCGSREKFIPAQYFAASWEDRLSLLRGLMDTDGTVDKRNGSASFCTVSQALRDGIVLLVRSLGGLASAGKWQQSVHEGKDGLMHCKLSVSLPHGVVPFHLERKARYSRKSNGIPAHRSIVSVEEIGVAEAQCIMIDSPEHLYVTDDYIVTHNTHAQRQGRIHRLGQKSNVEFIDLVGDHPSEKKARERLRTKYELRDTLTDPAAGLDDTGVGTFLAQRQEVREAGREAGRAAGA